MEIGSRLKKARTEIGFTQEKVAEELGVSRQSVSNWENNRSYPDIVSVIKLSDLYSVSLDELLKEDKNMIRHLAESMEAAQSRSRCTKWVLLGVYAAIWVLFIPIFWLIISPNNITFSIGLNHGMLFSSEAVMFRLFYPICTATIAVMIGIRGYFGKLKWLYIPINGILSATSYCFTWCLKLRMIFSDPTGESFLSDHIREYFNDYVGNVGEDRAYLFTGIISAALGLLVGLSIRYFRIARSPRSHSTD